MIAPPDTVRGALVKLEADTSAELALEEDPRAPKKGEHYAHGRGPDGAPRWHIGTLEHAAKRVRPAFVFRTRCGLALPTPDLKDALPSSPSSPTCATCAPPPVTPNDNTTKETSR